MRISCLFARDTVGAGKLISLGGKAGQVSVARLWRVLQATSGGSGIAAVQIATRAQFFCLVRAGMNNLLVA